MKTNYCVTQVVQKYCLIKTWGKLLWVFFKFSLKFPAFFSNTKMSKLSTLNCYFLQLESTFCDHFRGKTDIKQRAESISHKLLALLFSLCVDNHFSVLICVSVKQQVITAKKFISYESLINYALLIRSKLQKCRFDVSQVQSSIAV